MKPEDIVKRIDELSELGKKTLATKQYSKYGPDYVERAIFHEFRTAGTSFFQRTFGDKSTYFLDFDRQVHSTSYGSVEIGMGILKAARDEITGGWLFTIRGVVSAELFSNFLEMAQHLLEEGYKDAAAVMIGSVLEEHLRQVCHRHSIATEVTKPDGSVVPLKADAMNAELAKSVYSKLDQKSVTAWLDLRNKAAHGRYSEYTEAQVDLMLRGVMDFLTRNPA